MNFTGFLCLGLFAVYLFSVKKLQYIAM